MRRTLGQSATKSRSAELQIVAQHVQQRRIRRRIHGLHDIIDRDLCRHTHHTLTTWCGAMHFKSAGGDFHRVQDALLRRCADGHDRSTGGEVGKVALIR
jgi:hypothetical protein